MSEAAVVYGTILASSERKELEGLSAEGDVSLRWLDEPAVLEDSDAESHVFIDLDDARFNTPRFLLAVAKASGTAQLLGASRDPELDVARFAKLGVAEVLSPDQCLKRLHELLSRLERKDETKTDGATKFGLHAIVGISGTMQEIQQTVAALSEVDFPTALILGETGTGKSLVSRVLHNAGLRKDHNLVEVNCSAIPDELFESELFGHVKGAFTDAKADKKGLFEFAQNGTLFLDEVGTLTPSAQAKLLKVLEDKKLRRVGDVAEKEINVRVVAATNTELEEAVANGTFRQDLFYRLNLLSLTIPPLREHTEDIPGLAQHYLGYFATNYGKPNLTFAPETFELLRQHHWPGNVRELCNVIERAVLLNKSGVIDLTNIGLAIEKDRINLADRQRITIDIPPQGISLHEIEVEIVKQVLNLHDWNRTKAAKYLGISRPRLRRLIESAQLEQNRRSE